MFANGHCEKARVAAEEIPEGPFIVMWPDGASFPCDDYLASKAKADEKPGSRVHDKASQSTVYCS